MRRAITSGIANCTTSSLTTGSSVITATYSGATGFAAGTNLAPLTQYVTSTQLSPQTVPSAPLNVIVVPGNRTANISWTSPANTGGAMINGYVVGYLYSIDDTTPTTISSIGGKAVTTADQDNSQAVVWSQSLDYIWGIDDTSTLINPSPNSSNVTITQGQLNCDGVNDGSCATNNAYVSYQTPLINYAAGFCKQSIDTLATSPCSGGNDCYSDWYLPSVCELGSFGSTGNDGSSPTGNYGNYPNSQSCTNLTNNIQDQLASTSIVTNFSAVTYWSSTQGSSLPQNNAWFQFLESGGSGFQRLDFKVNSNSGVRCSQLLTL